MPTHDRSRYEADVAKRLMADDGAVAWRTLPQAIRETDDLLAGSPGDGTLLLEGLRDYLFRRPEEATAMMG